MFDPNKITYFGETDSGIIKPLQATQSSIPTTINTWSSKERKLLLFIIGVICLVAFLFFFGANLTKAGYRPVPIPETAGIDVNQEFSFTISPDNKWILYFETKYPYYDKYNLIAFDTKTNKKHTIDLENVRDYFSAKVHLQMENDCWSADSRYCVLPSGKPLSDPRIIETRKSIQMPADSPWLTGQQLAVSQFADEGGSVGYPNNAPDVIIDFSGSSPTIKTQFFDDKQTDRFNPNRPAPQTGRLTFDEISLNGFSCSDCKNSTIYKNFTDNSHGDELISPNGKYIAREISYGTGFVSSPKLYIENTKTGKKTFIASNTYYDMHFTSDSKRLYYYGCEKGGGCGKVDHLFYIDLETNQDFFQKLKNLFSKEEKISIPPLPYTEEERIRDLEIIQQKEVDTRNAILKVHYDILAEEFKEPQKVIGINGIRIYTENNRMVIFVDETKNWNQDKAKRIIPLVKDLYGKTVTIKLPPFEVFIKNYQDWASYNAFHGRDNLYAVDANGNKTIDIPIPKDPVYQKNIGLIYADVYYEGLLLNDEFK